MTKQAILNDILKHFDRTSGKVDRIGTGKPYLRIETDHGKAEQIGQYALRSFKQVQTYFACHVFKRATLSIYFKR